VIGMSFKKLRGLQFHFSIVRVSFLVAPIIIEISSVQPRIRSLGNSRTDTSSPAVGQCGFDHESTHLARIPDEASRRARHRGCRMCASRNRLWLSGPS
jgi:hypothetical protein